DREVNLRPIPERPKDQHLRYGLLEAINVTSLPKLLRYEERNGRAHGVEGALPFLGKKFANFALSLPEEYLLAPDGTSKSLFRTAMRGIVPDAILDRKDKIGFSTPEDDWLKTL